MTNNTTPPHPSSTVESTAGNDLQNRIATILQYGVALNLEGHAAAALEEIKCHLDELASVGVDTKRLAKPVAAKFFPGLLSFAQYVEQTHLMLHTGDSAETFYGSHCDAALGYLVVALCAENGVDLDDCLRATAKEICEYNLARIKAVVPTELDETIHRMKREILHDVRAGRVPQAVQSFGALHDHVDANEYGGFCIDELADALIAKFGGRDADEGMPQGMLDYINAAQDAIHKWIAEGGIVAAGPFSGVEK